MVPGTSDSYENSVASVEQTEFDAGLDELFNKLLDKVESGEVDVNDAERFFPEDVISRTTR